MEIGDVVSFDNEPYTVVKCLWRKISSTGPNILMEEDGLFAEHRRRFYVVEKDYNPYFIKEYLDIDYGGHAEYEYNLMKSLSGLKKVSFDGHTIEAAKPIAINGEMILMEYLHDYYSLNDVNLNIETKNLILILFLKYLSVNKLSGLQFTRSNFMVKMENDKLKVKMVDFEYSEGHDESEWFKFIQSFVLSET